MDRDAKASQCGLITHAGGKKEIVVAGGITTARTKIYDIDNDQWREGPPLPRAVRHGTAVPFGKTFLVIKGKIWKYNIENNAWDEMEETLATPRDYFNAFWVPDDYFCSMENNWSSWTEWSECPSCLEGSTSTAYQQRERTCLVTGSPCQGDAEERKPCNNLLPCPG